MANLNLSKLDKHDNMWIVLDDGGGATLVIDGEYVHYYSDMLQLVEDVDNYDGDVSGWDNNEIGCIGDMSDDANIGCRTCYSVQDVLDVAEDGWHNALLIIEAAGL